VRGLTETGPATRRVVLQDRVVEAARAWHYARQALDAADNDEAAAAAADQIRQAEERIGFAVEELDR
jgi:hypothetical protein